jgi:hypothetical protein
MKKEKIIQIFMAFLLTWGLIFPFQPFAQGQYKQNKPNESKRLFLEANIALLEKRYDNAHKIAENLITNYAGDYQISLYLRLYANTFYLLDENFQKGMLQPIPPGIQKRIDELKSKENKNVIDLVKLVWIGNGPGGDFSTDYMEEILQKFPESIWVDWAKWMLIQEREYRPREKYQDKSPDERSKLLMRDLYNSGKKFIDDHPDSYMLPGLLEATARWAYSSGDSTVKEEAVRTCYRVLQDYPNAEYDCAEARRTLRDLQGKNYKETPGFSEETDRIITQFYCISPEPTKHKKYTELYVQMTEQVETETHSGLPLLSYLLIIPAVAIAIAVLILLLKKSRRRRTKRFG